MASINKLACCVLLTGLVTAQPGSSPYVAPFLMLGPQAPPIFSAVDADRDGWMDALSVVMTPGFGGTNVQFSLHRNQLGSSFTTLWTLSVLVPASYFGVKALPLDFNGDLAQDLLIQLPGRLLLLTNLLGVPVQTNLPLPSFELRDTDVADVDQDGFDDVVVLSLAGVQLVRGSPLGSLNPLSSMIPIPTPMVSFLDNIVLVAHLGGTHTAVVVSSRALSPSSSIPRVSDVHIVPIVNAVISPPVATATLSGHHRRLQSVDFNSDGARDVVVLISQFSSASPSVAAEVILSSPPGLGNGLSLGTPVPYLPGNEASLANLDGIPPLDVVASTIVNQGSATVEGLVVQFGGPSGGLRTRDIILCEAPGNSQPVVADWNRDNVLDIAFGRWIHFGLASGSGQFVAGPSQSPVTLNAPHPWSLADGDGDGDLDVEDRLGASPRSNQGNGVLSVASSPLSGLGAPPAQGSTIQVDYGNDGDQDTLATFMLPGFASPVLSVVEKRARTSVLPPIPLFEYANLPAALSTSSLRVARYEDLTGDGFRELLITAQAPFEPTTIAQNITTLVFGGPGNLMTSAVNLPFTVLELADFNGDGRKDFLTSTLGNDLTVWQNVPVGVIGMPIVLSQTLIAGNTDRPSVVDLDGDGDTDILTPSRTTLTARAFLNQGGGTFVASAAFDTSLGPPAPSNPQMSARAADINRDGWLDLLAFPAPGTTRGAAIRLGIGPGAFAPPFVQALTTEFLADFTGDGLPDVYDPATGNVFVARPASGTQSGMRLQFGTAASGMGAISPSFGAEGPLRVNQVVRTRIRGGIGGASAVFALGLQSQSVALGTSGTLEIPILSPSTFLFPFLLDGPTGTPGAGNAELSFSIPPSLLGVTVYQQVGLADSSLPTGFGLTNALALTFGN